MVVQASAAKGDDIRDGGIDALARGLHGRSEAPGDGRFVVIGNHIFNRDACGVECMGQRLKEPLHIGVTVATRKRSVKTHDQTDVFMLCPQAPRGRRRFRGEAGLAKPWITDKVDYR
jgi:hypothetical protein